jgi:hypothetical protein
MNNLIPDSSYIIVSAGSTRAAALTYNGTIVMKGEPWPGTQPPTDAGYTGLALRPYWGFVIKENVKEAAVNAPLSPGATIHARDGSGIAIPFGSLFEHITDGVVRVFAPNGTQILWASNANATQARFPSGAVVPLTVVHDMPSGSTIDGTADYRATVTASSALASGGGAADNTVMTVNESKWYDEKNPLQPQVICFADTGCARQLVA